MSDNTPRLSITDNSGPVVSLRGGDAAKLLLDSGLLGEINRMVLHPRGLAISVRLDDNGSPMEILGLIDYRGTLTGVTFSDETLESIRQKLAAFDSTNPPRAPQEL